MYIEGPAGNLEAQLDGPSALLSTPSTTASSAAPSAEGLVIMCHPHPQYGGSMHDAVLDTAAQHFLAANYDCLRFNFRGVGSSQGSFDNGDGETKDLLAVNQWVLTHHNSNRIIWLGYSFGAAMVFQALQHTAPQAALLIAPPTVMISFDDASAANCQVEAIAGDQDNYVDLAKLKLNTSIKTHIIGGADHFFSAHHLQLGTVVDEFIAHMDMPDS